jgi:Ni/Fe-hydrogenase subunit HybB-like protein
VFGRTAYKPLGRLSGLLALALLAGGLLVLVLDLGRPDRLLVAATTYNFKSIFAWNIFLYSGFMLIVVAYLWSQADRKGGPYNKPIGYAAFVWRLLLTMGTGSIFGFLVARSAYDTAILPPMFIIMSFAYGLAIFILVLMFAYDQDKRPLGDVMLFKLKNLLGVFVAAVFFMTLMYFLTKLYGAKTLGISAFFLVNGGIYTAVFWLGWILAGCLAPLAIVYHPVLGRDRNWIAAACGLVILGGLATLYVIIIGGQAYPMPLFPSSTILESGFADGVNGMPAWYSPSLPEVLLGLGGIAVALIITAVGVRVLQFLPESLADHVVDPHVAAKG